jgi:hypothetical protein
MNYKHDSMISSSKSTRSWGCHTAMSNIPESTIARQELSLKKLGQVDLHRNHLHLPSLLVLLCLLPNLRTTSGQ